MSNKKNNKKIIFNDLNKFENAVNIQKNNIEHSISKIEDIEEELKKLKLLEKELNKKEKTKKEVVKKVTTTKKIRVEIPKDQKHQVVPVSDFEKNYDYDKRRAEWHKKAGHNDTQLVCSKCKDDDNWETILLDDGRHICYYCWIKKPVINKNTKSSLANSNSLIVAKSNKNVAKNTTKVQDKYLDYEKIYAVELDTLRTAFQVLPKPVQKEYEKHIYRMIDRLIELNFIKKRH